MKNMRCGFVLVVSCLLVVVSLIGCAQTTETATTTTTVPSGSTVSISGSLKTGTITGASVKASGIKSQAVAFAAVPNYNVVAVSQDTGKIYFASAESDSSGNFTISNLPSAESFYLEVLDSNNKLAAPVAFGNESSKPIMAIAIVGPDGWKPTLDLGYITYDSSKGIAAPTWEPTSYLDMTASVEAKSGETLVPKGAGNFGKGTEPEFTGTYDSNKIDGDKDGLPNFFDADNNGDKIIDEFDGLYTMEALSGVEPANFHSYVFTNLKVDFSQRNTFKQDYSEFNVAIGVSEAAADGGGKASSAKSIQSVKVTDGPAWIQKAKIEGTSTLWSASNYNLPLKSATPEGLYEVHVDGVKPLTDVNAGDILKFLVSYTDGTSEEAVKMLNFVFTDIPSITAYKVGSGSWQTAASAVLTTASTSEIGLRWTRPKDENGNEILGGYYTWEYNSNAGGAIETIVITSDADSTLTSLEVTADVMTFPDFKPADNNNEFMIGVCIRSIANDNAAENVRFGKGW